MAAETSFQFQCPSCSAVLQATLQKELTSVQCGECYDVFDVQHPGRCAPAATVLGARSMVQRCRKKSLYQFYTGDRHPGLRHGLARRTGPPWGGRSVRKTTPSRKRSVAVQLDVM